MPTPSHDQDRSAESHQAVDTPYRADIDGLRAIAVAAVILYHGFPAAVSGGFVGVDVFFVISGFLISGNIFRQIDAGRFGFADFYGRRIRRIFPALTVVLLACLGYGFVVLLPSELALLGRDVGGGAGFVSNLLLWHEAGYFDRASIAKPLLHLWSLGVEEQFYIVWPVALWLVRRRRRASMMFLLLAGIASLACSLAIVGRDATADFYSPVTRLWELDAGAILAWIGLYARDPALGRWADAVSVLGLGLILGATFAIDRTMPFPGGLALLPVAGALMLIAAGPAALINRTLLASRVAVFIGLISYPLYLWHWPLISFGYVIDRGRPLKVFLVLCLIAVAVVLAWVTYRVVERPFRFGGRRRRNTVLLCAGMAVIGLAGIATWRVGGFPERYPALPDLSVARINAAIDDGIFKSTPGMAVRRIDGITVARIGAGTGGAVMFTGDSVLYQYGPRVQRLLDGGRLTRSVYFVAGPSCAPVPGVIRRGLFALCNHLQAVASRVIARRHVKTIVIGANWAGYRNRDILVARHGRTMPMSGTAGLDAFYANLQDEVRHLMLTGHLVYLVLAPVAGRRFDPADMIRRSALGFSIDRRGLDGIAVAAIRQANAGVDRRLIAIATATGAKTLDPLGEVCGAGPICSAFFDHGAPKFADGLHLRPRFVARHITMFDRLLTR